MDDCDAIATDLARHLNTIAANTSIQFEATNPEKGPVTTIEENVADVQTQPWEEREEPIDSGDAWLAIRSVNVVVRASLLPTRQRKHCLAWLNEIKETFRELLLLSADDETDGWRWRLTTTLTLYDSAALDKGMFLSQFRAEFYAFG
jgi:hypothetical protein